jgi:hypothetical protein
MRRIQLEILTRRLQGSLIHGDMIGRYAVDFFPAFPASGLECQFDVFEGLVDVFVEVFGVFPLCVPGAVNCVSIQLDLYLGDWQREIGVEGMGGDGRGVGIEWRDLVPSTLAGDFDDTVNVDGLGVSEGVCEMFSGSVIGIILQV